MRIAICAGGCGQHFEIASSVDTPDENAYCEQCFPTTVSALEQHTSAVRFYRIAGTARRARHVTAASPATDLVPM